jgi:glutamine synthetase
MPLLCPTINSYKRIAGGEAFWAPNICSYGYDSRAASVRILGPPGSPDYATRFEVRVPGADMNAPLAFAAIFALGHYGIEKKLELPYGPIGAPGVTKESLPKLPTSLETATDRFMAKDSLARVVLGDATVDHIGGTRLAEVDAFKQTVTDWEKSRYMELV